MATLSTANSQNSSTRGSSKNTYWALAIVTLIVLAISFISRRSREADVKALPLVPVSITATGTAPTATQPYEAPLTGGAIVNPDVNGRSPANAPNSDINNQNELNWYPTSSPGTINRSYPE